ncbi:MAG: HAMP domain-containing methyl-accepting chemotaxis protein [Coriobacteriia bacterium]|nr:HAMP domain-containing methyl-accepting chemotaxis protein [Coriobacteriia bacterium]
MSETYRSSEVRRGLSFTFTLLTWATIGPAVAAGLTLTGLFALVVLKIDAGQLFLTALFGGAAMGLCAIPGSWAWRRVFKRRVLEPLRDLGGVMTDAGAGDLTIRATAPHDDEIGMLVMECNSLIASLGEIAGQVRRSSESVTNAATQLSASSQEINASSMEISSSVQQIAHGAELQSRKVEETSAAMQSISESICSVAEQAVEASRTSDEAAQAALMGEQATHEAISKISEVRDAIETLAGSVERLGLRSQEIGNIVDVITTIADQTNLLSLNAAIEAARAGESGRGFSVVAEEVRKLAEGSGKAAEQIGELIKDVQSETAKALKYMQIGTTEVAVGATVVGKTGDTLRQITEAVTRTAGLAQEIASATSSQARRTSEVDRAMHDIAAVVEENAASAEETAAAAQQQTACMEEISSSAQDLADMARRLEESVMQFRIDEGSAWTNS